MGVNGFRTQKKRTRNYAFGDDGVEAMLLHGIRLGWALRQVRLEETMEEDDEGGYKIEVDTPEPLMLFKKAAATQKHQITQAMLKKQDAGSAPLIYGPDGETPVA